jgi:hypothetical protein
LSIPRETGREDIALDPDLALQAPDERRRLRADGDQLRDRFPVLGDDDPLGIDAIEERQAALFELGRRNDLHAAILAGVRNSVHFQSITGEEPRARLDR